MEKWWKEAVAYQIYPRSFQDSNGDGIGDLKGVTSRLDYLRDLGIDVIWLCPMYQSPNDDNGYDISDYEAIMNEFGTMEDFDELLAETHRRGMKLILDLVINHTSDEHSWFLESRVSRDNPKRDWYIWRDGVNGGPPNNWESIFSGSAWEYDEPSGQYYMHLFSKKQPDLNWENADVRHALYEMMNRWMEKGIDGFRVDAISHIKKRDGLPDMENFYNQPVVSCFPNMTNVEGIDSFLAEMKEKTLANYDVMTVGEANGVTIEDADRWVGEENGYFNMIFQFEHLGLWGKEGGKGADVHALRNALSKWQYGLEGRGWNALFLENHDQPRSVSSWGCDDMYWAESAKSLAAMYFLMKGTPFIYQGQEIGMTNAYFDNIEDYNDVGMVNWYHIERAKGRSHEELIHVMKHKCRDNSRTPMQWDDSPMAGFTSGNNTWLKLCENHDTINVAYQQTNQNSVLNFYKQLIALRKNHKALIYGRYDVEFDRHDEIIAYTRTYEDEQFFIFSNLTDRKTFLHLNEYFCGKKVELLLTNYHRRVPLDNIRAFETRVYKVTNPNLSKT